MLGTGRSLLLLLITLYDYPWVTIINHTWEHFCRQLIDRHFQYLTMFTSRPWITNPGCLRVVSPLSPSRPHICRQESQWTHLPKRLSLGAAKSSAMRNVHRDSSAAHVFLGSAWKNTKYYLNMEIEKSVESQDDCTLRSFWMKKLAPHQFLIILSVSTFC